MIRIWTDGSCVPNPNGVGRIGYVITYNNKTLITSSESIGQGEGMTSNVAEYQAVIKAVECLRENCSSLTADVEILTDSQLVYGHIMKNWQVCENLQPYVSKLKKLLSNYNYTVTKISEKNNKIAHNLSQNKKNLQVKVPLD